MTFMAKLFLTVLLILPFTTVQAKPNELKTMIRTVYPDYVLNSTVYGLVSYILEGTDYRVYAGKNAPFDARKILAKPPPHQRANMLVSRIDALLMAVGDQYSIVVDHNKKLVSFTRNPIYEI